MPPKSVVWLLLFSYLFLRYAAMVLSLCLSALDYIRLKLLLQHGSLPYHEFVLLDDFVQFQVATVLQRLSYWPSWWRVYRCMPFVKITGKCMDGKFLCFVWSCLVMISFARYMP